MNLKQLKEPFPAGDIEWRVQSAGAKNDIPWARVLAYVTNRAIMDRLDDVCGPEAWKNEYSVGPQGGIICGLSIKCGDEWTTKWDGAENTDIESVKGGLSNAMKRAAVQWGIGRYLYNLEAGYADITTSGKHYQGADKGGKYKSFKWNAPDLPAWALPNRDLKPDALLVEEYYQSFRNAETPEELQQMYFMSIKDKTRAEQIPIATAKDKRKADLDKRVVIK